MATVQPSTSSDHQRFLYEKTFDVTETFLEWRHKVMTFTFTVVSGLLALAAWMYDHDLRWVIAVPLWVAAILCLVALLFDLRNEAILSACYTRARKIENDLGAWDNGPLWLIRRSRGGKQWRTYSRVLQTAYSALALLLLVASIGVAVVQPKPPKTSRSGSITASRR